MTGPGPALSAAYYRELVAPLLSTRWPGLPHAAARLGGGSEVLGLDDEQSRDHDWGLRLTLLVAADRVEPVQRYLAEALPEEFGGWPVRFATSRDAASRHRVEVDTVDGFAVARLGLDPAQTWSPADWLTLTGQCVLEVTAGAVFADTTGQLTDLRQRLSWYPDDVWRHVVAADWARIGDELPLLGRTGDRGDSLGARVILGRLTGAALHLGFMLGRSWPPYPKWLGTSFAALPAAASAVLPALRAAFDAADWWDRQESFCQALIGLHDLQRSVGLATGTDPVEQFHTRPYRAVRREVTDLLLDSVTDPRVRALPAGIGSVEQVTENVVVLTTARLRTASVLASDVSPAPAPPTGSATGAGHLVIVCGLPGSGKTTLASTLAKRRNGLRLGPDDWMSALGVDLWDSAARGRVEALQWSIARELLPLGLTVIIEWGTWGREERSTLRTQARALGASVELIYLDADDEELWRRLQLRGLEDPPIRRADLSAWRQAFDVPSAEELATYDAWSGSPAAS